MFVKQENSELELIWKYAVVTFALTERNICLQNCCCHENEWKVTTACSATPKLPALLNTNSKDRPILGHFEPLQPSPLMHLLL